MNPNQTTKKNCKQKKKKKREEETPLVTERQQTLNESPKKTQTGTTRTHGKLCWQSKASHKTKGSDIPMDKDARKKHDKDDRKNQM
jgi:hypothetical protein